MATEVANSVPGTVTVAGSELFDIVVRLMRAENLILDDEGKRQETEGSVILCDTLVRLYELVFGGMFVDGDLPDDLETPDCYAPIWRQAARAAGGWNAEIAA